MLRQLRATGLHSSPTCVARKLNEDTQQNAKATNDEEGATGMQMAFGKPRRHYYKQEKSQCDMRHLERILSQNGDSSILTKGDEYHNYDPGRVRGRTHPTFITRPGYFPPPYPRAEIGERGAKLLYPQLLFLICFLQQFRAPRPTRASTHPPT